MLFTFAYEAAGASDARLSLRPLWGLDRSRKNSGVSRRENAEACLEPHGETELSWNLPAWRRLKFLNVPTRGKTMARKTRKYSKKASSNVKRAMKKRKSGTLKSGRSG